MTDEERQENISSETIQNIYEIMTIKAVETMDDFIFQTIRPYCELVSQRKISKDDLKRALTEFFKNHPEDGERKIITLCKNCKFGLYNGTEYLCDRHSGHVNRFGEDQYYKEWHNGNYFCADGERRQ